MYNVQCTCTLRTALYADLHTIVGALVITRLLPFTSTALDTNHTANHTVLDFTSLHCLLQTKHDVLYTLYTLYSVNCTLYIVYCILYTAQCSLYHCALFTVLHIKVHYFLLDIVTVVSIEFYTFSFGFAVCFLLQCTQSTSYSIVQHTPYGSQCRPPCALDPILNNSSGAARSGMV